jgi:hypothetical protein
VTGKWTNGRFEEGRVIGVVFVRKLRPGKTSADFEAAWFPEVGFGVPARVISGPGVMDPTEVVTVGFVDADPSELEQMGERVAAAEAARHAKIDAVIESTELRTFFVVEGDHDFSAAPVALPEEARGFPFVSR